MNNLERQRTVKVGKWGMGKNEKSRRVDLYNCFRRRYIVSWRLNGLVSMAEALMSASTLGVAVYEVVHEY